MKLYIPLPPGATLRRVRGITARDAETPGAVVLPAYACWRECGRRHPDWTPTLVDVSEEQEEATNEQHGYG